MGDLNDVVHDPRSQCFEIDTHGIRAYLSYNQPDNMTIDLSHTYVPDSLRGQGVAARLAKAALTFAQEQHLKVIPSCPYIAQYIEKHKI